MSWTAGDLPCIKKNFVLVSVALFACVSASCGIVKPDYRDYNEESGSSGTPDDPCNQAALTHFEGEIQPVVVASCATSSCHLVTSVAGSALSASDAKINRAQLKAYTGSTSEKLFAKISQDGTSHGGSDKSAAMPKTLIDAWMAKEAECK